MTYWKLVDAHRISQAAHGFAVRDAAGARVGYLHGCVVDSRGRVQMLSVRIDEVSRTDHYLVPVGAVSMIDDATSSIHLRDIRRESIAKRGLRYDDELPEHRLMTGLQRFFPPPDESVVRRLAVASSISVDEDPQWMSLDEIAWK